MTTKCEMMFAHQCKNSSIAIENQFNTHILKLNGNLLQNVHAMSSLTYC
jgi:hypothetical protein